MDRVKRNLIDDSKKLLQALNGNNPKDIDAARKRLIEIIREVEKDRDEQEQKYFGLAQSLITRNGEIEIDEDAVVSLSEDEADTGDGIRGAYVQAWVWVDNPDVG